MADYTCLRCSKPFKRRGTSAAKYCSRECHYASRPASQFDFQKWHRENRERTNQRSREWAAANRDKRQATQARRRSASKGGASLEQMLAIIEAANGLCTYCGKPSDKLEFDHVDALAAGGNGKPENLLPVCRHCNASKGDRDCANWLYENHGLEGLARAIAMLEQRKAVEAYYPGVKIVEVK